MGRHFAWAKVALLRWLLGATQCPLLEAKVGEWKELAPEWLAWFDADLMAGG